MLRNHKQEFTNQNNQITGGMQPDRTDTMGETAEMFIGREENPERLKEIMETDHDAWQLEQYLFENNGRYHLTENLYLEEIVLKKKNVDRNIATIAGILFLVATIAAITAVWLYTPILTNPNYIIENGVDHTRISWGAFFEIITSFSVIGTSLTLYPVLRKYNEKLAIGTVCFRMLEATMIIMGTLCLLSIVALNQEFANGAPSDVRFLLNTEKLLLTLRGGTFLFGPNFLLAPSTFCTSYILFKMKLVPRCISVTGLMGAVMIFISAILVLFGVYLQLSIWGVLFALPVFCYEIFLAIWLIKKGFNFRHT